MSPPDSSRPVSSPRRLLPSAAGPFRHRGAVYRLLGLSPAPADAPRPAGAVPPVGFRYRSGVPRGSLGRAAAPPFTAPGTPPARLDASPRRASPEPRPEPGQAPGPRAPAAVPTARPEARSEARSDTGPDRWETVTAREVLPRAQEAGGPSSSPPSPSATQTPPAQERADAAPETALSFAGAEAVDSVPAPSLPIPPDRAPEPPGEVMAPAGKAEAPPGQEQLEAAWALVRRLGGRLPHGLPAPEPPASPAGSAGPAGEVSPEADGGFPEPVADRRTEAEPRAPGPAPPSARRSPFRGESEPAPAPPRPAAQPSVSDDRARREGVDRIRRATGDMVASGERAAGGRETLPAPDERRPKPRRPSTPPVTTVVVRRPPRATRSPIAFWRRNRLDTFRLRPVR